MLSIEERFNVKVELPLKDDPSEDITVTGLTEDDVKSAVRHMREMVAAVSVCVAR